MKKYILILFFMSIVIITSCSDTDSNKDSKTKNLTIYVPSMYNNPELTFIVSQKDKFEKENNVKINIDTLKDTKYEDRNKAITSMMSKKNGPSLIFVGTNDSYKWYIESGVALNAEGKVSNRKKLLEYINIDEYFTPISLSVYSRAINKAVLEEIGESPPPLDWDYSDYKDLWLAEAKKRGKILSAQTYSEAFSVIFDKIQFINREKKEVNLNNDKVKQAFKEFKDIIHSSYFEHPENYTFENYENLLKEYKSEEWERADTISNSISNERLLGGGGFNVLFPITKFDSIMMKKYIHQPPIKSKNGNILTSGFIVNRNGENIDLAWKFLDYVLQEEVQQNMINYNHYYMYPVLQSLEEDLMKTIKQKGDIPERFLKIREIVLEKIIDGEYSVIVPGNSAPDTEKANIYQLTIDYVFSEEEFTDKELAYRLKIIEDAYNIWLNE